MGPPAANGGAPALGPGDFSAKVEGAAARILSVRGPADDLVLLLVLDMVGDMGLIEPARAALVSVVQRLQPNIYVGLLRAQDGLQVVLDPTLDRAATAAAIQSFPVSGKAGLLDTVEAVSRVADAMLARSAVRVAVLYVTDSDIRNYREDYTNPVINSSDYHDMSRRFPEALVREKISKLDESLASFQAPVFLVHLDYRSDRLNEAYQSGLLQLAATTGGVGLFCRSNTEIQTSIEKIAGMIASHYSVDLELAGRPAKSIQVSLESAGRSLSYRSRFVLKER